VVVDVAVVAGVEAEPSPFGNVMNKPNADRP
jgi:hypothetical protein